MIRQRLVLIAASASIACAACSPSQPDVKDKVADPQSASRVVRLDPSLDAVVTPGAGLEKVATGFKFTEGPMWREGRLWFSDLVGNRMYALTPQGGVELKIDHSGGVADPPPGSYQGSNAMVTAEDGSVLMTQHGARRIVRLEGDRLASFVDKYQGKRLNSPNDAVFAPDGALWFTDPPFGLPGQDKDPGKEIAFSGVYRLAGGTLTAMVRDLPLPNGIAFSPDGGTLYVSNSGPDMFIRKYRVGAGGALSDGTIFHRFSAGEGAGVPDGLKVDRAGNVWATGPGGIHIIDPDGRVLGRIELPEVAANLAWAEGGGSAYITASTSIYRLKLARPAGMPLYSR
jgi:gluconolactonase